MTKLPLKPVRPVGSINPSDVNVGPIDPSDIRVPIGGINLTPTPIDQKYLALGGAASFLGEPLGVERSTYKNTGRYRHFQGGTILYTKAAGAHEVRGPIRAKYEALGWERSFLGFPTTDEGTTTDGKGRYNHFQGGTILWSPDTGAHEVHGTIREKYGSLGWEGSFLGFPVTDEGVTGDQSGWFQHFQGGSILCSPETGAHEVHGAIRAKYEALGWERSFLGYPVTDEGVTGDGRGWYQHFQGGTILCAPETGAFEVHGDVRARYEQLGWEASWLGFPTSDEADFPEGGRVSVFERGAIYWWPDTGPIELGDVAVQYVGLHCHDEMDEDQKSNSDEPYAVFGMIAPGGSWAARSRKYEDVDGDNTMPDLLELYRGKPAGLTVSTLLMENDYGDPDKYKGVVQAAVAAASAGVVKAALLVPVIGPVLSLGAGALLSAVGPALATELNALFNFGDDKIGEDTLALSAKGMVVLATRGQTHKQRQIVFKAQTKPLTGGGSNYQAFFNILPV